MSRFSLLARGVEALAEGLFHGRPLRACRSLAVSEPFRTGGVRLWRYHLDPGAIAGTNARRAEPQSNHIQRLVQGSLVFHAAILTTTRTRRLNLASRNPR